MIEKIMFLVHPPLAFAAYLGFTITFIGSLLYLWKTATKYDALAYSAAKLGVIFMGIAIVLGAVWAKIEWGVPWNWDPKQTTSLITFLVFLAYLQTRAMLKTEERKRRVSASLGIIGFIAMVFTFFSSRLMFSLMAPEKGQVLKAQSILEAYRLPPAAFGASMIIGLCIFLGILYYIYKKRVG